MKTKTKTKTFYNIEGYTIHRSDRNGQIGGGCLLAVSNSLISTPITMPDRGTEHLFVKVTNRNERFIVGAAYMPPGCSINNYIAHTEVVESLATRFPSYKLALFGDYNLAGITWSMINQVLSYNIDDSASRYLKRQYVLETLLGFFNWNSTIQSWSRIKDIHWTYVILILSMWFKRIGWRSFRKLILIIHLLFSM